MIKLFYLFYASLMFSSCDSSVKKMSLSEPSKFNNLKNDSVYFLINFDAALDAEIKKEIKEPTNFIQLYKGEHVSIFQIGCVSSDNFVSCKHRSGSYIFYITDKKIHLLSNNKDLNCNTEAITNLLKQEPSLEENRKEIILEQIKQIISDNQLRENKNQKF